MDGRLLSAQIPNRPRIPGVTGSRAIVPVEVLISASGTVQSVRPLGGTHLLREAAINAVRNWRYRPFLRNGQPIPVRTVVRVDFNEHTPQPAQRSAPFPP
jgi:protein TonB